MSFLFRRVIDLAQALLGHDMAFDFDMIISKVHDNFYRTLQRDKDKDKEIVGEWRRGLTYKLIKESSFEYGLGAYSEAMPGDVPLFFLYQKWTRHTLLVCTLSYCSNPFILLFLTVLLFNFKCRLNYNRF